MLDRRDTDLEALLLEGDPIGDPSPEGPKMTNRPLMATKRTRNPTRNVRTNGVLGEQGIESLSPTLGSGNVTEQCKR